MGLMELLLLLLVAGVCGGVGQSLAGYSRGGCLVSVALGFIGALLGSWMAGAVGLPVMLAIDVGGRSFPIIWSIIGSALFVAILGALQRRG